MPEKTRPEIVTPEAATPTRSLRASAKSTNPQARMQELLREGTAPTRREPGQEQETSSEGNNEGIFIVSEFPMNEGSEKVLSEDMNIATEASPYSPPQIVRKTPTKQGIKQGRNTSPERASRQQPVTKQSLKDAVLEEGRAAEERISKTRLNVDIDEDLHFWLKGHAIQNRRKLNDLIPRILKAYRDEVEGE